jgi:hypothetical protein
MADLERLIQTECDCVQKIKQKARELRAANPAMTEHDAFAAALRALPGTCEKYQAVRNVLSQWGVKPQLFR